MTAALAFFVASDRIALSDCAMRAVAIADTGDPKSSDVRQHFDRAILAARRELDERHPAALVATVAAWEVWASAALGAEAARIERDDYERTGYEARRARFAEAAAEARRIQADLKADAKQMIERIESGKPVPDQQRATMAIKLQKSMFTVEQAETQLTVFEKYHGPRQRRHLTDASQLATKEATDAWARFQDQEARLRRKVGTLIQLNTRGREWTGRLLGDLQVQAAKLASFAGSGRDSRPAGVVQSREAVRADLAELVRAVSSWVGASRALTTSLMAGP